jgi:hypothetical protein
MANRTKNLHASKEDKKRAYVILLIFFVAVVFLIYVLYLQTRDARDDAANTNVGANAAATATPGRPANAGQHQTPTPQPREEVRADISGMVMSAAGDSETKVRLYKDNQLISAKNTSRGQFTFTDVLVRRGSNYSLQVKAPGLAGEETFTIDSIAAGGRTLIRDVILKPQPDGQPSPQPSPSPSSTPGAAAAKFDDAQFNAMSAKVDKIGADLYSVKSSFSWLNTLLFVIMLSLLAALYLLQRGGRNGVNAAESLGGILQVLSADGAIARGLQKIGEQESLAPTLRDLSGQLAQLVQQQPQGRGSAPQPYQGHVTEGCPGRPSTPTAGGATARGAAQADESVRQQTTEAVGGEQRAVNWYRALLRKGDVAPRPVYLKIDEARSSNTSLDTRRICFNETRNQSSFVLYREGNVGWIFPNPNLHFAADHKYVYPELTQDNFEQQKPDIVPLQVQLQDDCWQLTL